MQKSFCVFVFVFGLLLKVSLSAGATPVPAASAPAVAVEEDDEVADGAAEITADDSSKVVQKKGNTRIENNIRIDGSKVSYDRHNPENPSTLVTKDNRYSETPDATIIPMLGGTVFNGNWYRHVSNAYTLGLALDIPVTYTLSLELIGIYGRYSVSYSNFGHNFNQYDLGANAKLYLSRGKIQPYVGGGFHGLYYDNMYRTYVAPGSSYSMWEGSVEAILGADVEVGSKVAVGLRGSCGVPFLNRPSFVEYGNFAAPGYEDASLMNNIYTRVMGTVRIGF